MAVSRILLLEDDQSLVDGLSYALCKNGYEVDVAHDVAQAFERLGAQRYDLLLLDVGLPDGTGFDVCGRVRRQGSRVPVIFLTAADEELNVVRGLDGGGDDYVTKPFRLGELCSRIRALLRRAGASAGEEKIVCGDLSLDALGGRAWLRGEALDLTAAEYRLLALLVRNANHVVTREAILDALWDSAGAFVDGNTLSVYVRRLREKVEKDPSHPEHLLTARGFGYQWKEVSP